MLNYFRLYREILLISFISKSKNTIFHKYNNEKKHHSERVKSSRRVKIKRNGRRKGERSVHKNYRIVHQLLEFQP